MNRFWILLPAVYICAILIFIISNNIAFAGTVSDIQAQINENNRQLEALRAEIASFQNQLDILGTRRSTLQSTIRSLTLSQEKLDREIRVTQNRIASANLKIRELGSKIHDKEKAIVDNKHAIARVIRGIADSGRISLVAKIISANSLGEAWMAADHAAQFNRAIAEEIYNLRTIRAELTIDRDSVSAAKDTLVVLQNDLTLQRRSVQANRSAKERLLSQTRNQEVNYQRLVAQKQAAGRAFQEELLNLQRQLDLIVNPAHLPRVGSGVLSWPFGSVFMRNCTQRRNFFGNRFCISQFFGNTPFATANPQIYNWGGHTGIDIAAPIGTPVRTSLSGVVLDTGNTDLVRGCYSFGKWVMIVHGNGLSTLYAHLSEIDVARGQSVVTGQVIGLSGMTGFATGPHLHFGVYATDGTKIMTLRQFRGASAGCANAKMPVAMPTAYLNPLSYL